MVCGYFENVILKLYDKRWGLLGLFIACVDVGEYYSSSSADLDFFLWVVGFLSFGFVLVGAAFGAVLGTVLLALSATRWGFFVFVGAFSLTLTMWFVFFGAFLSALVVLASFLTFVPATTTVFLSLVCFPGLFF